MQFFTLQEFRKRPRQAWIRDKWKLKLAATIRLVAGREIQRASENSESAWKKWWYKICMWIVAETIFKVVLSSVCRLVYVPSYLVKGPVGINKGKKMEHFSLEKTHANFLCLSVFPTHSIISLDRWVHSQLMAVTFVSVCKDFDKLVVVVEINCKVYS